VNLYNQIGREMRRYIYFSHVPFTSMYHFLF
jgi:hypothetical protein